MCQPLPRHSLSVVLALTRRALLFSFLNEPPEGQSCILAVRAELRFELEPVGLQHLGCYYYSTLPLKRKDCVFNTFLPAPASGIWHVVGIQKMFVD